MPHKHSPLIFLALFFFFPTILFSDAAMQQKPNDLQIFQIQINAYFYERGYQTFEQFSDADLLEIAQDGFNAVWILGVWQKSPLSKKIQQARGELPKNGFRTASAYAIYDYKIDSDLGGEKAFRDFVARAKKYDLRIILDITPNSLAADSPWVFRHPEWFVHKKELPKLDESEKYFKIQPPDSPLPYWIRFPEWGSAVIPDLAQVDLLSSGYWVFLKQAFEYAADLTESGGVRIDYLTDFYPSEYHAKWFSQMPLQEFEGKLKIISENVFGYPPAQSGMVLSVLLEGVKKKFPNFITLGEVYRGQELEWQHAGVDLTYAKYIYDWLVNKRGIARDFAKGPRGSHGHYLSQYAGRKKAWKIFSNYFFRKGVFNFFPEESFFRSLYFSESHDEVSRIEQALANEPLFEENPFLAQIRSFFRPRYTDEKKKELAAAEARLIATALATVPGVPIIYMGQNQGKMENAPSAVWFGNFHEPENLATRRFYRTLLNRTKKPVFRRGTMIKVPVAWGWTKPVFVFARYYQGQFAVVALNYSENKQTIRLNFKKAGISLENKTVELPPLGTWIEETTASADPAQERNQI